MIRCEIHFHEQELASLYLESDYSGLEEMYAEVGLAAFFATRMLINLGDCEESSALAGILYAAEQLTQDFASGGDCGVRIIRYPGDRGRYYFLAELNELDLHPRFDFSAKGFGVFAKGVGYYGPLSVLVLIQYFSQRRAQCPQYLHALRMAMGMVGKLFLDGKVSIGNQNNIATLALATASVIIDHIGDVITDK